MTELTNVNSPFNVALRIQMEAEAEALRVQRWWDTFNAALPRAHSGYPPHEACNYAAQHADIMHGEIEKGA
jgi:hypothetical protein